RVDDLRHRLADDLALLREPIEARVHGDAMEPRAEARRAALPPRRRRPDAQEDLLRDVLGISAAPEHALRERDHPGEMALDEPPARRTIAAAGTHHQRFVGVVHRSAARSYPPATAATERVPSATPPRSTIRRRFARRCTPSAARHAQPAGPCAGRLE